MRCPAGSLRNLNFPFAVTPPAHQVKIAAAWILRIVRRPSRAAPFAEIYLRPGGRGCVYVFAISGDGSRQTARRAIRIVTMIRVPRRVAVLGTVFTRRVPRASARQRSCAGAGGPRDGYIFFKVRLDLVCRLRLSWRWSLGDYGAYFNRAEKSVSLRATNLFRNLLWHALGTVTCPPLLSPAIESSCSHANRVMLRSVAKPLLESPLKRVHHKTQYP